MLNYIVKYQNNYVTALLISKQVPSLIEKGVPCSKLFQSKIFCFEFDYDEWPGSHHNDK